MARQQGTESQFGAFLDSTLDRLADMVVLVGVALFFAREAELGHVLLTSYVLVAGVLVSYIKARAELVIPSLSVGFLERAERVIILAVGAIFDFMIIALWILAVGSTITVIQRFARAHREMRHLNDQDGLNGSGPMDAAQRNSSREPS